MKELSKKSGKKKQRLLGIVMDIIYVTFAKAWPN
jgi:hypothetical protein